MFAFSLSMEWKYFYKYDIYKKSNYFCVLKYFIIYMDTLDIKINKLKNIFYLELSLPIKQGLYAITGTNGIGKSTLMTVVSKVIQKSAFNNKFRSHDYAQDSFIELQYQGVINKWYIKNNKWACDSENEIKINGFSEGSIIHGIRFSDANFNALIKAEKVYSSVLKDADEFVIRNLSYILHGDDCHYKNLKRIKNKSSAIARKFKCIPYFIEGTNGRINQFRMSTGENMLISLLHMLNAVIIHNGKIPLVRLILIDEIELALHPAAISRLVDFLDKLSKEYNLAIYFSSHSIELLRKIKSQNLFHLQQDNGCLSIVNPCYPAYATRDIYQHSGYDFLILVEDILAKYIIENIIDENSLYKSKLINILPTGGWENVIRMQDDICRSNLVGVGTKIVSILDGDAQNDFESSYKSKGIYSNLSINFLPIQSLEKYLFDNLYKNKDIEFYKDFGDRFFKVKSLGEYIKDFKKSNDNKAFYKYIIKGIQEQGISEDIFIQKVCEMIYSKVNMDSIINYLKRIFQ